MMFVPTLKSVCLATVLSAVAFWTGTAQADADLSGFQGRWKAVEMESTDTEASKGIDLEHLDARIDIDGEKIRVRGSALVDTGGESIRFIPSALDITFIPTERKAVLAPLDAKSKLLGGLIADPERADPMAGETVRWARIDGDRVVFYRLAIDDAGAYTLGQYVLEKTEAGMTFHFTAFAQKWPPVTVRAKLERAGD